MIYVFEGARNSGKSFLSTEASKKFNIPRFQFNFVGPFNLLGLDSKTKEAHSFAMGKELMLMQIGRDLINIPSFIHDRGILSVLSWAVFENRISKEQAINQINYLSDNDFFSGLRLIYIEGNNPNPLPRNKDQWDLSEGNDGELSAYNWVLGETKGKINVTKFNNNFDSDSVTSFLKTFESIL
jgi:hypothetical protein